MSGVHLRAISGIMDPTLLILGLFLDLHLMLKRTVAKFFLYRTSWPVGLGFGSLTDNLGVWFDT